MTDEENQKTENWINDRLGAPNLFNRQLLEDFLEFAIKELGYCKGSREEAEEAGYDRGWPDGFKEGQEAQRKKDAESRL